MGATSFDLSAIASDAGNNKAAFRALIGAGDGTLAGLSDVDSGSISPGRVLAATGSGFAFTSGLPTIDAGDLTGIESSENHTASLLIVDLAGNIGCVVKRDGELLAKNVLPTDDQASVVSVSDNYDAATIVVDSQGNVGAIWTKENEYKDASGADTTASDYPNYIAPPAASRRHVFVCGQSVGRGLGATPALTTTQPFGNKMFLGGPATTENNGIEFSLHDFSAITDLVAGANAKNLVENLAHSACNFACKLAVDNGKVVPSFLASVHAIEGQPIVNLNRTGIIAERSFYNSLDAAEAGCQVDGKSHVSSAIIWDQGESDGSTSGYKELLRQYHADLGYDLARRTGQGNRIPFITSLIPNALSTNIAKQKLAGELADFFVATDRYFIPYGDGTHPTNHGQRWYGHYIGKCLYRILIERQPWVPFSVYSVVRNSSSQIDVFVKGAVGDVVFDTSYVTDPGSYGFRVLNGSTAATISGVTVQSQTDSDGLATIRLSSSSAFNAGAIVSYAYGNSSGTQSPTTGNRGNVRDSDPVETYYGWNNDDDFANEVADSSPYDLRNWLQSLYMVTTEA
jgi:hypothetical protein